MTELQTGLPSVRQIQSLIREGQEVELKLLTGDLLNGKLRWQDQHCLCLSTKEEQQIIVWLQAIAYVKP
ncbi:MAG: RNA-binding protein hfq [Symploca sp. SIO2G7]|nr:RNA-binding protein hfq [Symploca sp. SIO2G7]